MNGFRFANVNPIDEARLQCLRNALGSGPVLILTHDNPDPDALASGSAFAFLFREAWGISSRLIYSGLVSRAENKAVLSLLTPEWEHEEVLSELNDYTALALVDTQPGAGNNSLADALIPQVVIDHHFPTREGLDQIDYVDIRTDMGASASLAFQYLEATGVIPDNQLATAIFYGIHTDTLGLSRGGSSTDQEIYINLLRLINRDLLAQVEQARLPREYFLAFTKGIYASRIYGRVIICYLGEMLRPDFVAEMADLLIRLENIKAALCIGYHEMDMYLSMRTIHPEMDAGSLIQQVILPPGKAGGHGTIAGGRIPITPGKADRIFARVQRRFLNAMGETHKGEGLL